MKKKIKFLLNKLKVWLDRITTPENVKRIYISSIIVAAVLITITTAFGIYVGDYYHADDNMILEVLDNKTDISCHSYEEGIKIYRKSGEEQSRGFIFYPGGKVEARAYEPLMYALADRGIVAVLCEMPFNLAVFDMNAADGVAEMLPEITEWYIGGHSLGGTMASYYYAENSDWLSGVILLGSYSTKDISGARVLSIYGSCDGVLNSEKYEECKSNLPSNKVEVVIEGGNHAYFGMYGEQQGDGEASISNLTQITLTAEYITNFITGK